MNKHDSMRRIASMLRRIACCKRCGCGKEPPRTPEPVPSGRELTVVAQPLGTGTVHRQRVKRPVELNSGSSLIEFRWYFISRSLTFDLPPPTTWICGPLADPFPVFLPRRGCRAINATVRTAARPLLPAQRPCLGFSPFCIIARRARVRGPRGLHGSSAAGAALRAPISSCAPQNTHAHTSLGRAALCLARTRRAGLGRPGSRSVPTASCAMRSIPLAQDLQRQHPSPVPPLQNAGVKWTQNGMGIRRRGPRRRLGI